MTDPHMKHPISEVARLSGISHALPIQWGPPVSTFIVLSIGNAIQMVANVWIRCDAVASTNYIFDNVMWMTIAGRRRREVME